MFLIILYDNILIMNKNIKDIKLIATDLDGTLLNDNGEISEYNAEIFQYLMDKGVEIILSTGRHFEGMKRYNEYLNNKNYSIVLNGAAISDFNGNFIYEKPIEKDTAEKIMDIYGKYDLYLHVYSGHKYIVSKEDFYFNRYVEKENITDALIGLNNIEDFEFSKMLFIGDREELEKLQKDIKNTVEVYTSFSHTNFLEILREGINKGSSLEWLCNKKEINRENVIALGDNYNDIEMIEFAGIGVAMANGEEELKKRADYITESGNERGVGKFLKDFLNL